MYDGSALWFSFGNNKIYIKMIKKKISRQSVEHPQKTLPNEKIVEFTRLIYFYNSSLLRISLRMIVGPKHHKKKDSNLPLLPSHT